MSTNNDEADIARLPAYRQRDLIGKGELSARELLEVCWKRLEQVNPRINAVVTISETAEEEAKALDERQARGEEPGLLHGLVVGIKDVTPVQGLRTTYGCTVYADNIAQEDALVVRRLREAGAVILGKTNTPEFAAGGNTFNPVFGRTRNPWNLERSAGGSTGGGAAALAAGIISMAEGTDLGGSLRIPAAFCGVAGLRPSPGLVPTVPSEYLWDSLQVSGGLGRTFPDIALFLQAVAGPSDECPIYQPTRGRDFLQGCLSELPKGMKVAYCADISGYGVDSEVEQACREAAFELRQAGVEVEEVELDFSFARQAFLALRGYWMVSHHLRHLGILGQFGDNLRSNIEAGLKVSSEELAAAERARGHLWRLMRDVLQNYDHLLTPTLAVPPFPVEQNYPETIGGEKMGTYIDWLASTFLLSLTSLPVASVPVGPDASGFPAGLQVAGRPLGEEQVLSTARHLQDLAGLGLPPLD
ncbi:MAG TPA: amidase family protein [Acidobacteriota bacterium]|nr:amidase family protein [Acidobacteriota bacterium]